MAERLGKPEVTWSEDFHRYTWADRGVSVLLERFHEESKDVRCEVTVESAHNTKGGQLYFGHLLLIGPRSKGDAVRALTARDREIDWDDALEQVRGASLHRLRKGEPVIDAFGAELQAPATFLQHGLIVDRGATTWFGDGGGGKSVLATAAQFSVATGVPVFGVRPSRICPTLYLDWEDDSDTWLERIHAMCAAYQVEFDEATLLYQRQVWPIKDRVREVKRAIAEAGVGFVVIDSVGMAGSDPDSASEVVGVYNAARALAVPALLIHHIAKDARDKSKPYGSVYAHNASRYSVRIDSVRDGTITHLAMEPQKTNRTAGQRPVGVDAVFFSDETHRLTSLELQIKDVRSMPAFKEDKTPLWQRIEELLTDGVMRNAKDIASALGSTEASVRRSISEHKDTFVKIGESWGASAQLQESPF